MSQWPKKLPPARRQQNLFRLQWGREWKWSVQCYIWRTAGSFVALTLSCL